MSQAELLPTSLSPSVSLHSGRPATTSLEVAKFFGKQHQHVMRSIDDLQANTPESFSASNFGRAEYTDEQGKPRPMFILYRDGFMLLVMGYTGKKALAMKLAYIEAFNRMEAELAARSHPLADDMVLPPADAPITPADQSILQSIVKAKIEAIPADKRGKGLYPQLWSRFNNHFRLGSYKQLPQCRMADAVTYLMGLELPADRKEELPPPLPQDLPADMDDGRKDALRMIRSIMDSMLAARSVVNLFLYPRPVNMNSPHFERLTHNAQHDFYAAALDCLSAAYQALEAGYRLQHAILPSVERS